MAHGIFKIAVFAMKGAMLGFTLGIAGAIFGVMIGNSFLSIWQSGMPLAMAFMGAVIFCVLSAIGMHNGFRDELHDRHIHTPN